jgi:predicted pyridoxine 5'-phosphate oxidase superfamily flavin-nucleotide-binding protein
VGILTDEMRQMVNHVRLSFVATTNQDGTPNLSPKGTVRAVDDEHLVFVDIASPQTIKNLRTNPRVEVNSVDFLKRRGYRFKGVAELVSEDDAQYAEAIQHLHATHGPQYSGNHVVRITVNEVRPRVCPADNFKPGVDVRQLELSWMKRYGVQPLAPERVETSDR